jgi:hypothetical protein
MSDPQGLGQPTPQGGVQQAGHGQTLPPDIPESWLRQISQASRSQVTLPDIPELWLNKIKEVTKPNLVSTILGSSLLAALIAMGSATLTSYMGNRGAEKLEKLKLQLQSQNDQVKKRVRTYSTLAHDLDALSSALDAYLRMSMIAARAPRDTLSASSLLAQRNRVGLAEKEVLTAKKDIASYDTELASEVDDCLGKLSPALAATQENPEASSSLDAVLEQLKQLVSSANDGANKSLSNSPFG